MKISFFDIFLSMRGILRSHTHLHPKMMFPLREISSKKVRKKNMFKIVLKIFQNLIKIITRFISGYIKAHFERKKWKEGEIKYFTHELHECTQGSKWFKIVTCLITSISLFIAWTLKRKGRNYTYIWWRFNVKFSSSFTSLQCCHNNLLRFP